MFIKVLIASLFILNSCTNNPLSKNESNFSLQKKENIPYQLQKLMRLKAEGYIREMRKELDGPIYVNVLLIDNSSEYFEFSIYVSDLLLKDDEIPYDFSLYQYEGKNIIYFYSNMKYYFNKEIIIKQLKENKLIKDNNIVLGIENTNKLNDFISWYYFVCKNDLNKIILIKSPYVLDYDEKPKYICK